MELEVPRVDAVLGTSFAISWGQRRRPRPVPSAGWGGVAVIWDFPTRYER